MRVALFFIDGIGLGQNNCDNPFFKFKTPHINKLLAGRPFTLRSAGFRAEKIALAAIDATLGVEGLPQSATGQATIFTGQNAAAYLGKHLRGFPNQELRELLQKNGIFNRIKNLGKKAAFLNAYRPFFFTELNKGLPGLYSCSTMITYYGGVTFRSFKDLIAGRALYADITNQRARELGYNVPAITPREAGKRFSSLIKKYDFSLYEYYISDLVGHSKNWEAAERVVNDLDEFIGSTFDHLDLQNCGLVITSDHGNFEDLSSGNHTLNPVPALFIGEGWESNFLLNSIQDILPAIVAMLKE